MTGEITLAWQSVTDRRVKEKVLAAARFGLETIILPKRNEADLSDVPEALREKMKMILVDTVDEVFAAALTDMTPAQTALNGQADSEKVAEPVVIA